MPGHHTWALPAPLWHREQGSKGGDEFEGPVTAKRSLLLLGHSLHSLPVWHCLLVSNLFPAPTAPQHCYTSETCWGSLAWRSPYSHLMTRALRSMTEMP